MVDRQPTNPGRVRLDPVSGQPNVFDMSMADGATEQGTPLNKATFLKDATAALYGLSNAVPDDVFAWLGKYAEHYWKRRTNLTEISLIDITSRVQVTNGSNVYLSWGDGVDSNGQLTNQQGGYVSTSQAGANQMASLAPVYFKSENIGIHYLPAGTTVGGTSATIYYDSSMNRWSLSEQGTPRAKKYNGWQTNVGEWEIVFSTNRNAYPDSGIVDGYEYEYIGIPFDKLPAAPQIETGSYVGTGTYGESSPCSLTFSFVPKLLVVQSNSGFTAFIFNLFNYDYQNFSYAVVSATSTIPSGSARYSKIIEKTVSWYSTQNAAAQANESGGIYHWTAIG